MPFRDAECQAAAISAAILNSWGRKKQQIAWDTEYCTVYSTHCTVQYTLYCTVWTGAFCLSTYLNSRCLDENKPTNQLPRCRDAYYSSDSTIQRCQMIEELNLASASSQSQDADAGLPMPGCRCRSEHNSHLAKKELSSYRNQIDSCHRMENINPRKLLTLDRRAKLVLSLCHATCFFTSLYVCLQK